jgi:hypothetical protein
VTYELAAQEGQPHSNKQQSHSNITTPTTTQGSHKEQVKEQPSCQLADQEGQPPQEQPSTTAITTTPEEVGSTKAEAARAKRAITHPQTATKEEVGSTQWHKQSKGSHQQPSNHRVKKLNISAPKNKKHKEQKLTAP